MAEAEFDSEALETLVSKIFDYLTFYFEESEDGEILRAYGKGDTENEQTRNEDLAIQVLDDIIKLKSKIPEDYQGESLSVDEGHLWLSIPDAAMTIDGEMGLRHHLKNLVGDPELRNRLRCIQIIKKTDRSKIKGKGIIISEEDGKKPDYDEIRRADPRK